MASAINGNTTKLAEMRPGIMRPVIGARDRASLLRIRRKAEKAVERLIAVLDELSGDPDLEEGGDDEPEETDSNLGWSTTTRQDGDNWRGHIGTEDEYERDDADAEPSLGAPERHPSPGWGTFSLPGYLDQTHWAKGATDDRENDGDDREPDDLGGDSRE